MSKKISGSSTHEQQLKRIRKKRSILFYLILFTPMYGIAIISLDKLNDRISRIIPIFWLCYLVLIALASITYSMERCPRCHKYFIWSWGMQNPTTNKCVHCGLYLFVDKKKRNNEE